jgi:hypothetical protein
MAAKKELFLDHDIANKIISLEKRRQLVASEHENLASQFVAQAQVSLFRAAEAPREEINVPRSGKALPRD